MLQILVAKHDLPTKSDVTVMAIGSREAFLGQLSMKEVIRASFTPTIATLRGFCAKIDAVHKSIGAKVLAKPAHCEVHIYSFESLGSKLLLEDKASYPSFYIL